jgi:hypothetical protein
MGKAVAWFIGILLTIVLAGLLFSLSRGAAYVRGRAKGGDDGPHLDVAPLGDDKPY